jgi:hypothetical protein
MSMPPADVLNETWPSLPLGAWLDTSATLHLWTQIVGKVRLTQCEPVNHSWHVTLYLTARGLTTGLIPHRQRSFQIDFDFLDHALLLSTSDGRGGRLPLRAQPVSAFYQALMHEMSQLGVPVQINCRPNEIENPVRFDQDDAPRAYDPVYAQRYWQVLLHSDRVFKRFRSRFLGKCSPVHYFWGAPDLAVTRFSGRRAPQHPGGIPNLPDAVTREAYSHEVSSAGFWAGGGPLPYAAYYSYAYPEPLGFAEARAQPDSAYYHPALREFILPYHAVHESAEPDETLLAFLQSTYEAAADLGKWDRTALETPQPRTAGHER